METAHSIHKASEGTQPSDTIAFDEGHEYLSKAAGAAAATPRLDEEMIQLIPKEWLWASMKQTYFLLCEDAAAALADRNQVIATKAHYRLYCRVIVIEFSVEHIVSIRLSATLLWIQKFRALSLYIYLSFFQSCLKERVRG